jgi:hypothetical protein
MIRAMRGAWIVGLVIALGIAGAGFFAQGMARLAGLPDGSNRTLPAVSAATAATGTAQPAAASAVPNAATSAAPAEAVAAQAPPAPTAAQTAAPTAAPTAADSRMLQAIANAPDAPPAPVTPAAAKPARAAAPIDVARTPTLAPTLTAEERHAAQCRSLRAWLTEIDTLARTRSDAETQAWVQSQRATTRERQLELSC